MNNKFEFRAWNGSKMLHNVGVHPHIIEFHGAEDDGYDENSEGAYTISPAFKNYTIMQFTRAYDKNKVKIFEDDVVRWESKKDNFYHVCRVIFDSKEFLGYVLKSYNKHEANLGVVPMGLHGARLSEIEVIGNAHENLKFKFK